MRIPHELGNFFVLLYAGFTKTRALFFNFLTGLFAILGTLVALLVGSRVEDFSSMMLPLAAGGFIYIAGSDLVPELNKEVELSKSLVQLIAIATGVGLMLLSNLGGMRSSPPRLFLAKALCYSPCMSSILIKNIGTLVTGKLESPLRQADSIFIKDGVVQAIGNGLNQAADHSHRCQRHHSDSRLDRLTFASVHRRIHAGAELARLDYQLHAWRRDGADFGG